jgi:hypothetical protein
MQADAQTSEFPSVGRDAITIAATIGVDDGRARSPDHQRRRPPTLLGE